MGVDFGQTMIWGAEWGGGTKAKFIKNKFMAYYYFHKIELQQKISTFHPKT